MSLGPDKIRVWQETKALYRNSPPRESMVYNSFPIGALGVLAERAAAAGAKTEVVIVQEDCVEAALKEARPLLLNMADWNAAGGCVEAGSGAQEEELFRRSDYHKCLHQRYYPLGPYTTIYSPQVEFYRRGPAQDYALMTPVKIDCIAAPAVRGPSCTDDMMFSEDADVRMMENKIQALLAIAAEHGHRVLVLSAWGCGAFGCPPKHVAEIFHRVLRRYDGVFSRVVFAVLGRNYRIFREKWEQLEAAAPGAV